MIVITFYECLALFFILEEQHLIKLSDTFSSKNVTNALSSRLKNNKHFIENIFIINFFAFPLQRQIKCSTHFLTIAHL